MNKFGYSFNPERNTVTKVVQKSKHLFRKDNAWAVDAKVLEDHPTANFVYMEIEEGFNYTANAEKIMNEGFLINYGDEQVALPVQDWIAEPNVMAEKIYEQPKAAQIKLI